MISMRLYSSTCISITTCTGIHRIELNRRRRWREQVAEKKYTRLFFLVGLVIRLKYRYDKAALQVPVL